MMIVRRRQEGRIVKRIETELSDAKFMCRGSSAVDLARSIMRLRRSDLARDPEGLKGFSGVPKFFWTFQSLIDESAPPEMRL